MPMFVTLAAGVELTDELVATIKNVIRVECSPRHVPDRVFAVSDLPRTLTGKILEIPVKRLLMGAEPDTVASRDSLANPGALDEFQRFWPDPGRAGSVVTVLPPLPVVGRPRARSRTTRRRSGDAAARRGAAEGRRRPAGARRPRRAPRRGARGAGRCSRLLHAHADELANSSRGDGQPATSPATSTSGNVVRALRRLADKPPARHDPAGLARTVHEPYGVVAGHPVQLAADPPRARAPRPRRGQLRAASNPEQDP
jgi:hypothetical protein